MFSQRISLKERGDVYRLGERGAILAQVGNPGLVASVIEQSGQVRRAAEAISNTRTNAARCMQ